eukprot:GHUV01022922.1.p1 GENE.GHUV01022922.1~~GHUV01022922.1.p1  ORF type:complete len:168 (+),score=12.85 GHUV01022922.1:288-791(+)
MDSMQQTDLSDQKRLPLRSVDPHTAFLYAPHTVSCLLLGIGLLAYFSGVWSVSEQGLGSQQQSSNAAAGVWAAVCVFLGFSVVQGPQTSMLRPHPAVWRLVHGTAIVYMLGMVWLLFQTGDDARLFLRVSMSIILCQWQIETLHTLPAATGSTCTNGCIQYGCSRNN